MSRGLTVAMQNALSSGAFEPVLLADLTFVSTTLYLAIAPHDLTWNGHTYQANGWLNPPRSAAETSEIRPASVQIELAGIPSEIVSLILSGVDSKQTASLYFGCLSSGSLIADPFLYFKGRIDVPEIKEAIEGASVTISYENHLISLERPKECRMSNEWQKAQFDGDIGFDRAEMVADWNGYWGGKKGRPDWIKRRSTKKASARK